MSKPSRVTIGMPRLGETMEQGTIAKWLVDLGSNFKRGDPLLELETDKTLVEYPALGSGTLIETLVESGDIVEIGAPIAIIESDDTWQSVEAPSAIAEPTAPEAGAAPNSATASTNQGEDTQRATPLARRLARTHNVGLDSISGSGRRGRIEARDVENYVAKSSGSSATGVGSRTILTAAHPIIFVHGFAGLGSNWATIRSSLNTKGLANTAPDLPGHGQNELSSNSVQDLINWLIAHLEEQEQPVHLVGHSLGAHVAALAAQARPNFVARLSLVAPVGCGPEINGKFLHGMAAADSVGQLRHFMRLLGAKAAMLPNETLQAMANELAKGRLTALATDVAQGNTQRVDTISAIAKLSQSMPVNAIFGMADSIISKEHVFNMPPQVSLHIIRSGHMPHWDAPGLLEKLIC